MRCLIVGLCLWLWAGSIPMAAQCNCPEVVAEGTVITVGNVQELVAAVNQVNMLNGNSTIILLPGEYQLTSNLRFIGEHMANTTIMGSTDNKEDVYVKGLGWNNNAVTHIFNVAADNFTVANMTVGEVFYHPIQVHSNPADADNFRAINVKFVDAKEQLLKVSGGGDLYADDGIVMCCEFEFTNGIAYQFYTGGIDAHRSVNWEVKHNTFRHIRSPENALAEHAIHFWRECSGTIVDANLIINCDRGIGFGLGQGFANGHTGGLIMNNMVHTSRDVGIGLESSTDTKIYNNTVITDNYPRSIEYRFSSTTDALISNNLVNGEISDRSSGSTGQLSHNHRIENLDRFVDASDYNYRLATYIDDDPIVGAGTYLPEVTTDYDCEERNPAASYDIGADQFLANVSTNTINFNRLRIYPNPNQSDFQIEGLSKGLTIEIYNTMGFYKRYIAESDSINLSLGEASPGIYYVKVAGQESLQLLKMVVR